MAEPVSVHVDHAYLIKILFSSRGYAEKDKYDYARSFYKGYLSALSFKMQQQMKSDHRVTEDRRLLTKRSAAYVAMLTAMFASRNPAQPQREIHARVSDALSHDAEEKILTAQSRIVLDILGK